ncbi:hypothetical protein [Acinetobacter sp. YH12255]|uniref:hypothetical protein n=1 Tax=Acinetobacter sp. YH12255 TaxID=2601179 RepID=UPI0015D0F71A|nr:hypothetical protein [Acinetobacter sp. YH12255]
MTIDKLSEFASDGQKDVDDLVLTDGFPVTRKPARQWFNWLFNTLTSKINEIIDADFMPKSDVVDNLTTNDATKPLSAKQGEVLDEKITNIPVYSLPAASTTAKGGVKVGTGLSIANEVLSVSLNNTLTSTSATEALTAAQGKVLNDQAFGVGQTWQDVKANRVTGTTYANTTGKPILVVVNTYDGTSIVDSVTLRYKGNDAEGDWSFIVPSGSTYSVTGNIRSWAELR